MILITGINGFIGSQVARILAGRGKKIRGLIRNTSNLINIKDLQDKIELVTGDIRDGKCLRKAFRDVSICYHLAALVKTGRHTSEEYFSTNLQGTMNVAEEALKAGVKRFIYTSTCETLRTPHPHSLPKGEREKGEGAMLITENIRNSYSDMIGNYGRSKFLAEEYVKARIAEGLPAVITNPIAVIGPGDINLTAPGYFILTYLKGKIPVYFETGFNIVDVRDTAEGLVLAAERGKIGERYILGNENVLLTPLFKMLKEISGKRPISVKLPHFIITAGVSLLGSQSSFARKVRASRRPFFFDCTKARAELGWRPRYDLETTLKDAWEWYLENSA